MPVARAAAASSSISSMPLSHAYAAHAQAQSTARLRRFMFAAIALSLAALLFMNFFEVRLKIRLSKRVQGIFGSDEAAGAASAVPPPYAYGAPPSFPAAAPPIGGPAADIPMPAVAQPPPSPALPPAPQDQQQQQQQQQEQPPQEQPPQEQPPAAPRVLDRSRPAALPVIPLVYDRPAGIVPTYVVDIQHWKRPHNVQQLVDEHKALDVHVLPAPDLQWVDERDPYDADMTDGEFSIVVNRSPLTVRYDADMSRRKWRRILRREEIEYAVAHYLLWRKAYEEKIPMMFVLESGAVFTESDEQVKRVLSQIPNPETFDVCFLQHRENYNENRMEDMEGTNGLFWRTKPRVGSYGYVFTYRFAKAVYNTFFVYGPADEYIARAASFYISTDKPNRVVALAPRKG